MAGAESGYSVSGGLHGVGVSSRERSIGRVRSDGLERRQGVFPNVFERKTASELQVSERKAKDGNPKNRRRVRFKPDNMIFQKVQDFDPNIIRARMKELAFLNSRMPSFALRAWIAKPRKQRRRVEIPERLDRLHRRFEQR